MRVFLVFLFIVCSVGQAAPYTNRPVQRGAIVQESLSDLRHEVDNHEAEISMLEERLNTQEAIIDSLRQQLLDANFQNKELVKGSSATIESKLSHYDSSFDGVTDDLKKLQGHANDSSKALSQYKKKFDELENRMEQLQTTLQLVLDALQIDGNEVVYEVKSGDSLEKIARRHQTSVSKIKGLNQLTHDRIFIGQKLKLP